MISLELPAFGPDPGSVSGFTEPGHEAYGRLFLPMELSGRRQYLPWRRAAERAGVRLDALTTWRQLEADGDPRWERPQATMDDATAEALVHVLANRTPDPSGAGRTGTARFALWTGYAGEIDTSLEDAMTPVPATGENFLCDGSYGVLEAPLDWLLTRTDQRRCHLPGAIWSPDQSLVLAAPRYHDSVYLSCSQATFASVRDAGLDLVEIDPHTALPTDRS